MIRILLFLALIPLPVHALTSAAQEFMAISKELEPVQCEKRRLRRQIALAEIEQRRDDMKKLRARFAACGSACQHGRSSVLAQAQL